MGLVPLIFTAISTSTEWTKAIAMKWEQILCDDSYKSVQKPLFETTKMAAEFLITPGIKNFKVTELATCFLQDWFYDPFASS